MMPEENGRLRRRQSDQILEGWTWGRVTKIGGSIMIIGSIVTAVISATLTVVATKRELKTVIDTVNITQTRDSARFRTLENRLHITESSIELIPKMATVQCMQLERDRSLTLARAARLPCDSLTK